VCFDRTADTSCHFGAWRNAGTSGECCEAEDSQDDRIRKLRLVALLAALWQARAQAPKEPYPIMAPLDQYLMERNAEIALARSAAPESSAGA
jgi:hypothetical protein